MKKIVLLSLCILMLLPVVVNAAFTDVPSGHWAEEYINKLTDSGVINGMGDGTFAPDGTLTKGQFIKLIMQASLPKFDFTTAPKGFDHWAAGYVSIAYNYGVLESGEITVANIEQPITRIEVVKILSKCDIIIRTIPQDTRLVLETQFFDVDGLSEQERYMLIHAVRRSFINGYPDGTFQPNKNLTRAEASKIISTYMDLF